MANEKYIDGIHRYFAVRKQVSGLAVQHVYDIQIPLVDAVDITYSIDESFDILKHALAPLGEDYVQLLDQAREERWIDFLPCAGKQGGAYSAERIALRRSLGCTFRDGSFSVLNM